MSTEAGAESSTMTLRVGAKRHRVELRVEPHLVGRAAADKQGVALITRKKLLDAIFTPDPVVVGRVLGPAGLVHIDGWVAARRQGGNQG